MWDLLIKKLQDEKTVGVLTSAIAALIWKLVGMVLARKATARVKRKDQELDQLDERAGEEQTAAEEFSKDAEIARLRKMLLAKSGECAAQAEHIGILEEAKGDLELELARARVREATGKHKALPPNPIHSDPHDTLRPRKR